MERTTCRLCGSLNLLEYLDLGMQTLANEYLSDPSIEQSRYPLVVNYCQDCGHSQLSEVVDPHVMFDHYLYVSGTPKLFNDHCDDLAKWAWSKRVVDSGDLIVDIASNDGTMLSKFNSLDVFDPNSYYHNPKIERFSLVGIDPAKNLKSLAEEKGIDQFDEYLSQDVAHRVITKYGKAKLIIAQNVFAHVDDLNEFMKSISVMLDPNGMFIIEAPYLGSLLEEAQFDTVYHEHLSYFLTKPLKQFCEKFQMCMLGVKFYPNIHGGTMRYHIVQKIYSKYYNQEIPNFMERSFAILNIKSADRMIEDEEQKGFYDRDTYQRFNTRVSLTIEAFLSFVKRAKMDGKKIALFGAGAKGCVFINSALDWAEGVASFFIQIREWMDVDSSSFCAVYDENEMKQGLYLTGSKIPIKSPKDIVKDDPDYIVILTWNFKDEIMRRCILEYGFSPVNGKRFVVAIPTLQLI